MTAGRRQTRIPIQLEVEYRTSGNFLVAYSTNLSKGGLFLQTDTPLGVGARLKVRFRIPGIEDPIEVEGFVAWSRSEASPEGHPAGMGVEFQAALGGSGAIIDRVVSTFKGLRIIVVGGPGSGRSLIGRYLRSIITCNIQELTAADTLGPAASHADLAIVEIDSSGPEGFDVIRSIRSEAKAPVIALAVAEEDRALARKVGADEVLGSPPGFNDLQAAVIRVLARPSSVR